MLQHWLLITFSWLGTVRLQYINTGGPGAELVLDPVDNAYQYPLPYLQYYSLPPRSEYEHDTEQFYPSDDILEQSRSRRRADEKTEVPDNKWPSNFADSDKTVYLRSEKSIPTPFIVDLTQADKNGTEIFEPMEKKYFSPWGGKRDKSSVEHMWTWKRGSNVREPSMPKRVRFSPWGGKRSGQMIYKAGDSKGPKLIFSTTIPELTRIMTNTLSSGGKFNFAGYQVINSLDKRHPIKILSLSTRMDDKTLRETMPFKTFLETLPKIFKPGHPYLDVNLKKDGKRKVKFSAWGGKRSPPIIGPIWTPAPQDIKDSTLNTILLIRNSQGKIEPTTNAV